MREGRMSVGGGIKYEGEGNMRGGGRREEGGMGEGMMEKHRNGKIGMKEGGMRGEGGM